MSKAIWIYSRKKLSNSTEQKIYGICKDISPENIASEEPRILIKSNTAYGVMNPKKIILYSGNSLLLGVIAGNLANWNIPLQDFPNGSYALFRDDEKYCEIVSDSIASRTIWYFKNEDIFVASTSQVALIKFIGGFKIDRRVIPWMLSTGSLGPSLSWDKRLKRIPPNSSVILNKDSWSLEFRDYQILFKETKDTDRGHEQKLKSAIISGIESMNLNFSDWVLPISGGYDSRGILCMLKSRNIENLKTITWGLKSSLNDSKNDAFVAKKLTKKLNVSHKYFHTGLSNEPIEKIIDRFIKNGEGRIDHISGYLDGFKIWETLHNENIQGVIRGDEGFGWTKVSSVFTARRSIGLNLCSDYSNLEKFAEMEFLKQQIPEHLEKSASESLAQWRDRLYHEYRIPTILSALSDLKLPYVELVNPLLFKNILEQVRKLPDHLRTEKFLFKKIVVSVSPKIEFASCGANASISSILKHPEIVDLLKQNITDNLESELFPKEFLINVLKNIKTSGGDLNKSKGFSFKAFIKSIIPSNIKELILSNSSTARVMDYNQLGFRVYIIFKMVSELKTK